MKNSSSRKVIGAVVATAAMTSTLAGLSSPASASVATPLDAASIARNRLEAGLMSASLAEKLAVAGDRVRAVQLAETAKPDRTVKPQSGKAGPGRQFAPPSAPCEPPPPTVGCPSCGGRVVKGQTPGGFAPPTC